MHAHAHTYNYLKKQKPRATPAPATCTWAMASMVSSPKKAGCRQGFRHSSSMRLKLLSRIAGGSFRFAFLYSAHMPCVVANTVARCKFTK